jgi:hypothetical protein
MLSLLALSLLAATTSASMQKWDVECGSKFDRINTQKLSLTTADGKFTAGTMATLDTSGVTNLHGPFMGGSWSIRVYEDGASHPVGDYFGDLSKVLTFPDLKNTTFKIDGVQFKLPKKSFTGKFQVAFTATDFQHATYFCVDAYYGLDGEKDTTSMLAAPEFVVPTFSVNQDPYTVTKPRPDPYTVTKQEGNFTISNVQFSTGSGKFRAHETATVVVKGVVEKKIDAGAVKYQIYETGVSSFIASGNSNYFDCNNKGCDRTKPIALKLTDTSGKFPTDYELTFEFTLPALHSDSKQFRVVLWGEDQDHFPYDMSATITFNLR